MSPSASQFQAIKQSHENDETFEVILPYANTSGFPKSSKGNVSNSSSRGIDKKASAPSNSRVTAWIVFALAVGAASGLFVGGFVSRDTIHELRSEFKRDLDSLRDDIEHELGVHLMATAAVVQTKANEIATEAQDRHTESAENIPNDGSHLRGVWIFPSFEWTDTIRGWLQTVKIFASAICDWVRKKLIRLCSLRPEDISTAVQDWFENTDLFPAFDLESLALRNPFADGIFFSGLLRLFSLLLITYCVAYDWVLDRFVDRYRGRGGASKGDIDSSPPVRDEESSNQSRKGGAQENIPDLVERREDAIMEQAFYDSVASAMRLPGAPGSDTSLQQNDNSHHRFVATRIHNRAVAIDSSPPIPTLASGTKISTKERIRRARINAQAFGARDKLKLSNAAAGTIAPAGSTTVAAKRSPVRKPSRAPPSPWHVKQQRLERARANAKIFGEKDKERLRQARADSPWRKKSNSLR